jgi:hypothetical protein
MPVGFSEVGRWRPIYHWQMLMDLVPELNLPYDAVSRNNFPLPILSSKLESLSTELTNGVGFFQIRGLDPMRWSNETNVIIYLGISSYVAEKRGRQDELGNMLRASVLLSNCRRNMQSYPPIQGFCGLTHTVQSI